MFNIAWGVFVIAPFLAPVFMQIGATGVGNGIYFVYQFFCHQLPERSFFLFGPRPMYPLSEIATVTQSVDPFVLRQFIGGPEWGWKVAYSDRMVSMYTGFWIAALVFAAFRRRIRPLPIWGFLLLCLADGARRRHAFAQRYAGRPELWHRLPRCECVAGAVDQHGAAGDVLRG